MKTSKRAKLRVLAVLDGRPGHEKQTLGIIQGLEKYFNVELLKIQLERRSILKTILYTGMLFLPGKGLCHPHLDNVDLLIGTGTKTHLSLLLLKKGTVIPAITCMSPGFYLRRFFDLCFIPMHDGLKSGKETFLTLGAPNSSKNMRLHQKGCGLILVGGVDIKSHRWDSDEVARTIRLILEKESLVLWTLSSSPRTPEDTVCKIKELETQFDNVTFFDYRDTKPGWIEEQYNKNEIVWVTSDSISMVYEAITAGCRVGIIPMQWLRESSKFKRNEDILLKKNLVISFSSWEQGDVAWAKSTDLNEAQRCAEQIVQKWWPKNLL